MLRIITKFHYLVFSVQFFGSFSPFTNLLKLKDYTPNFLSHSAVTLARYQRRRHVGAENRPTNARCLPRSHNPWRLSSSQRGSLVGRLALLIVIPECSTLPIRVCFGQVCLSPAETYFSNYHTQLATLPSSLVKSLPLLPDQPPPKRRLLFFALLSLLALALVSFFFLFHESLSTFT